MLIHGRRDLSRYGIAFLSVGLVLTIHLILTAAFQATKDSPFLLVFGAVMVSAWYGGRGPGLLATVLLVPVIDYSLLEPTNSFFQNSVSDNFRLFLFVTDGILISVLGGALHKAEARKSSVLASATDAIVTMDHKGRIVDFNPAAEAIFGWTRAESVGKYMADVLIPARLRAVHREGLQQYLTTRDATILSRRVELSALRCDGTEFPVEFVITPLISDELPMFTAFIRDISQRKQAEERLRETNERFRVLAESIPSVIWTAAPDGTIKYVNEQWFEYTGLTPEQNVDWPGLVLHPDDRDRCIAQWTQALKDGTDYEIEIRNRRHDGTYRWFLTRAVPFRDNDGRITAWFGTTTDIENRKRSEAAQHFLAKASAVLSEMRDLETTLTKIVELAVPSFADWSAVDIREDDGSLRRLVASADDSNVESVRDRDDKFPSNPDDRFGAFQVSRTASPELLKEISADWLASMSRDPEHQTVIRESGITSYICIPLRPTKSVLGVLTFAMIESQRCYDDEDLLVAKELAQRVSAAVDNANLMRALQEADRRKDEFLANVSHELRTPMNSILGMLQLGLSEELAPELRDYLGTAKESAENLLFLLDDILDFSRFKVGGFQIEPMPFRVRETIDGAMKLLMKRAFDKELDISWQVSDDVPDALLGDNRRLRQVIINLVNNSIKFTERGKVAVSVVVESPEVSIEPVIVQVSAECQAAECPDDNDQADRVEAETASPEIILHLTVADTGIGIAAEHQEKIFAAFTQLDASTTRVHSGIGLGLAICRELVNQMGGRIWLESELGRGSSFHFSVPFQIASVEPELRLAPAVPHAATSSPLRVLLCEDTPANQKVVQGILARRSHQVEIAQNGREAIARAARETFDVILMDVQMPIVDGLQATAEIRKMETNKTRIPIIGISAHAMRNDKQRFLVAGMDECLSKPIDAEKLIEVVERLGAHAESLSRLSNLPSLLDPDSVTGSKAHPSSSVLDREAALKRLGGDNTLFRDLIRFFDEDSPSLLEEIRAGLQNGDVERITQATHSLKGLVANFSSETAETAARIEDISRSADLKSARETIVLLERQIARLHEALAPYRTDPEN